MTVFDFPYSCFPKELKNDIEVAIMAIPNKTVNNVFFVTKDILREYELTSGIVLFPYRLYFIDVRDENIKSLTDKQKKILYSLYTRSNNRHLREKYINKLLHTELEEWCLPFIVGICDDYVVEILELIYSTLSKRANDDIKEFCKHNKVFVRKSYSRMVSYWNAYYRYKDTYRKFSEYVGKKLFKECLGFDK